MTQKMWVRLVPSEDRWPWPIWEAGCQCCGEIVVAGYGEDWRWVLDSALEHARVWHA